MDVFECGPGMDGNWQPMSGNWQPMSGHWRKSGMSGDRQQLGNRSDFGAFSIKDVLSSLSSSAKAGLQTAQDKFIVGAATTVVNDPRVQAAAQRTGLQKAIDEGNQALLSTYNATAERLKISQDTAKTIVLGGLGIFTALVVYKIYKMVK